MKISIEELYAGKSCRCLPRHQFHIKSQWLFRNWNQTTNGKTRAHIRERAGWHHTTRSYLPIRM